MLFSAGAFAQEDWEDQTGDIEDAEVVIEKNVKIVLPFASRNFEKIAPLPLPTAPTLTYGYQPIGIRISALNPVMRVRTLQDPEIAKLYGNYAKAGFGNFGTPYLEAVLNSKRNKNASFGASIYHLSSSKGPVDGKNSASGTTAANIHGKAISDQVALTGAIDFQRDLVYFYGYPEGTAVLRDSLEQNFNRIKLSAGLESTNASSAFQYQASAFYRSLTDNYSAKEGEFGADLKTDYTLSDKSKIKVGGGLNLISQEDEQLSSKTRSLFRAEGGYEFDYNSVRLYLGAKAAYLNDTLMGLDKLHLYPDVQASYALGSGAEVYGGLTGGIIKNTLGSLSQRNPYLQSNLLVFHSNNELEVYGGLRGKAGSYFGFNAGFSLSNVENMAFFLNGIDPKRFVVAYEPETTIFNFYGEFSANYKESVKSNLRVDIFSYNTELWTVPLHQPGYKISLNNRFNIYDKIRLTTDIYVLGGLETIDATQPANSQVVALDDIIDISAQVEYLFSKQFSFFTLLNNVTGTEYQRYFNYPSRGFQVIVGATYSF